MLTPCYKLPCEVLSVRCALYMLKLTKASTHHMFPWLWHEADDFLWRPPAYSHWELCNSATALFHSMCENWPSKFAFAWRDICGVSALKLEHIILVTCSCSAEFVFLNICLTSQSIAFLLWTANLTGDGWASGKIGQLCDWSLITERFPLICQMSLPFGGSDLLGLFTQPRLCYMTLQLEYSS